MKWGVGVWIEIDNNRYYPKKKWNVLLNDEKVPIGYEQTYENGITMRLTCSKLIQDGKIIPLDISGQNGAFVYSIHPLGYYCLSES